MLKRSKLVAILLLICLTLGLCSGCSKEKGVIINGVSYYLTANMDENVVMKSGDCILTRGQIKLLYECVKDGYTDILTGKIWTVNIEDVQFTDAVVDSVKEMAARLIVVNLLARQNDISLSTDQKLVCANKAQVLYEANPGMVSYISLDETTTLFEMMALSDKCYTELTADVNKEISIDEARVIKIMYIYSKDSLKSIQDAKAELDEGNEFIVVAGKYSDSEDYIAEIGRGEMVAEFEKAAFSLDAGQTSEIINCDNGYYIVKCMDDNIEDKALGQRQLILENRCRQQFNEAFDAYAKNVSIYFDEELWNKTVR